MSTPFKHMKKIYENIGIKKLSLYTEKAKDVKIGNDKKIYGVATTIAFGCFVYNAYSKIVNK